jgi:hypothetical protein
VGALSAPAAEPSAPDTWQRRDLQKFETIEPGGRVAIVNPLGNIYARFGGYEDRVEVLATLQERVDAPAGLDVALTRTQDGLDVNVSAGGVTVTTAGSVPPGRVDLVTFIPEGAVLDARTEAGRIEIKGLRGDVVASSVKGDIWIRSVRGRVRAKTARGDVSVALETGVTALSQDFTTETGDIEIELWEDADMSVDLATSGEISTDFSIEIDHHPFEEPGKHGTAVVGKGGPELRLRSKRGRIRLLRLQRNFKPGN